MGRGKATREMLPMIAVPTTSGTGSEAQSFALISDAETHVKMACGDKKAACRIALLDPTLTDDPTAARDRVDRHGCHRARLGNLRDQARKRCRSCTVAKPGGCSNPTSPACSKRRSTWKPAPAISKRVPDAGHFLVRRFMRRVRTFGFHVATLDVTQHARVHDAVIGQGLGQPQWPTLSPEERLHQLRDLLARDQGPVGAMDAIGRRTLGVFEAIAHARHKFGARAIGQYIVSGAQGPEDVLAVLLLARSANITDKRTGECPLDVAPLLESIPVLERAGEVLRSLHDEPAYRHHLAVRGNRQQIVIGYSDPSKEGGIAASRWALQAAQVQLVEAARVAGITLTLCHGRGGTPPRGGGRTEHLVEAAPHGAIRGVFRLTEQGEVVNQSYGLRPIAMRTLERTFAAVALATAHVDQAPAPQAQVAAMQAIAKHSLEAYRRLAFGGPEFFDYFRAATPLSDRGACTSDPVRPCAPGARDSPRCAPSPGYSPGPRAGT